jgi:putative ABC transport system substrate-binding protein
MMNRKIVVGLVVTLVIGFAQTAGAQQAGKVPRIGVLVSGSGTSSRTNLDALRHGVRELGYVEGRNIAIEYRYAEGKLDKLPQFAVELVGLKLDVLVAGGGNNVTRALRQATAVIPIVMTSGSDAVAGGLVASLARPGGNVTGLTSLWDDLSGKRLGLLKEAVLKLSRVAVLWETGVASQWKSSQTAARGLGLQLYYV